MVCSPGPAHPCRRSARGERPRCKPGKSRSTSFAQRADPAGSSGLWSLYVIGGTDGAFLRGLLDHEHESVRAWAIRLLTDDCRSTRVFSQQDRSGRRAAADLLAKLTSWLATIPRAWCGWCWPRRCNGSRCNRRIDLARALLSHERRRLGPQPAGADLDGPYSGGRSECGTSRPWLAEQSAFGRSADCSSVG